MDLEKAKAYLADPRVSRLSSFQENVLWRLVAVSDGNPIPSDPVNLIACLFPLKPDMRSADVQRAVSALVLAGLAEQFVDELGAPSLLVHIRPPKSDEPTQKSVGGIIGGDDDDVVIIRSSPNSLYGEALTKTTDSVPFTKQTTYSSLDHTTAEYLGLSTAEFEKYTEKRDAIVNEAKRSGLRLHENAIDFAMKLADEYTLEWLLAAIKMSFDANGWGYVHSILKQWKKQGYMGDSDEHLTKTSGKGKKGSSMYSRYGTEKPKLTESAKRRWGITNDGK